MNKRWIAALCIALFVLPAASMAKTRVLLIAIEKYQYIPRLPGPIKDATKLKSVLIDACNVNPSDISERFNSSATRQGILTALRSLTDSSGPGDLAVIYYSGHGTQVPDQRGGDEDDQLDEAIVCYDFNESRPSPSQVLRDDDVGSWLKAITAKGAKVVYIVDSCHSGTSARAPKESMKRFQAIPRKLVEMMGGWPPPRKIGQPRKAPPPVLGLTTIEACRPEQSAYSVNFSDGWMGVLTRSLIEVIREKKGLRYADLAEELNKRVKRTYGQQTPAVSSSDPTEFLLGRA